MAASMLRRPLRLRTRVMVFFALGAALLSIVLSVSTYTFARRSVLQQRERDTIQRAYVDAQNIQRQLTTQSASADQLSKALQSVATGSGTYPVIQIPNAAGRLVNQSPNPQFGLDALPASLTRTVQSGTPAMMRASIDGQTMLVVGLPLPTLQVGSVIGEYYEIVSLQDIAGTLNTLGNILVVTMVGTTLLGTLLGWWVSRGVLRPLGAIGLAAEAIASGRLGTRLEETSDPDLERIVDTFNQMATNLENRIEQTARFTSDVSHELRTPLTTVRMAADVLYASRDEFPPGLSRSSELLVNELDRFETLLRDLLEISRLDAGVEELSAESTDVRSIVHSAVEQVRGVLEGNTGSDIVLELPDEEVTAEVDSRRVERILRNLLANAVDHGEGHPVRLILAADDHAVALSVRDYGVGLRPGEAELVFNRFWRADPSRNRRTGGTGLGLAISHEDARLHGGWLEAWGEPGCGSCFRLTLPRVAGDTLRHSPVPLPPDPPAESGGTAGENREATAVLSASQDRDGSEAVVNVVEQEETR